MAGADPNWDDATRDAIHKRIGLPMGRARLLADLAQHDHPQCDDFVAQLVNGDEDGAKITKLQVSACVIGTDTSVEGYVFVSIEDETPGAAQRRVRVYKDQPRATLVAQGNAADAADVTIAPEAGYTFAAVMKTATITANMSLAYLVTPPTKEAISKVYDGTQEDDAQLEEVMRGASKTARALVLQAAGIWAAACGEVYRAIVRRKLVSRSSESVLIDPGLKQRNAGQVEEEPKGIQEDLRLGQETNTGGSAAIKAGAATQDKAVSYASGWTGITTLGPTLGKRGVVGVLTLACEKTLDGTPPRFGAIFDPTDTRRKPNDGKSSIRLPFQLVIGKSWKDPSIGIEELLIDYSAAITNSTGTSLSATAADWVRPNGLTSSLSDAGKLYTYYRISDTRLLFFSDSTARDALDESKLVTYASLAAASVNTAFLTQDIGNGLTLNGKTGAGTGALLVNGDKGTVNYQPPAATQPQARVAITISETVEPSLWVKAIRDGCVGGQPGTPNQQAGGWEPNTGAAPNLEDGWIRAGLPFINSKTFRRRG